MTTPQRATNLSGLVLDPVLGKATEIIFGQCGNCLHRVKCSSRMINVRHAMRLMSYGEKNPLPSGRYSRAAAKVFLGSCGKCDQVGVCIRIWCKFNSCEEYAEGATKFAKELGQLPQEEVADILEGYMRALRISGTKLIGKAATMWWKCDKDKAYVTTTMLCLEGKK